MEFNVIFFNRCWSQKFPIISPSVKFHRLHRLKTNPDKKPLWNITSHGIYDTGARCFVTINNEHEKHGGDDIDAVTHRVYYIVVMIRKLFYVYCKSAHAFRSTADLMRIRVEQRRWEISIWKTKNAFCQPQIYHAVGGFPSRTSMYFAFRERRRTFAPRWHNDTIILETEACQRVPS